MVFFSSSAYPVRGRKAPGTYPRCHEARGGVYAALIPTANSKTPINLTSMNVGGSQSAWREPIQAQGENTSATQTTSASWWIWAQDLHAVRQQY